MTTRREELEQHAMEEGVTVISVPLPQQQHGAYMRVDALPPLAAIAPYLSDADGACALGVCMGYHHMGTPNLLATCPREAERYALRAGRWAGLRMLPPDAIGEACLACDGNPFAMAEMLGVTPAFLENTLQHYRDIHGQKLHTGRYVLRFMPALEVTLRRDG